jgi:hypothetical protein
MLLTRLRRMVQQFRPYARTFSDRVASGPFTILLKQGGPPHMAASAIAWMKNGGEANPDSFIPSQVSSRHDCAMLMPTCSTIEHRGLKWGWWR